jgi:hypothetical protein
MEKATTGEAGKEKNEPEINDLNSFIEEFIEKKKSQNKILNELIEKIKQSSQNPNQTS